MPQRNAKARHSEEPAAISTGWLVKWIGAVIAAAFVCMYLAMCLLFYQGQWQLVFHPSHLVDRTPASIGMNYDNVRFDADETGHVQLSGWWIPAEANAKYGHATMLLCHDNVGSVSDTLGLVSQLHSLGINVFAFDYHGFGGSDWAKPSESLIYADTNAAVEYLTGTRHIDSAQLALYGEGMGAAACAHASAARPLAALILVNPLTSMLPVALTETQTRFVPIRLLLRDRLELQPSLQARSPKLFVKLLTPPPDKVTGRPIPAMNYSSDVHSLFLKAADPKMYWEEPPPTPVRSTHFYAVLSRFLDEYLPSK
jgi:pimeloyl-ACP methyl ester carboxylesterase